MPDALIFATIGLSSSSVKDEGVSIDRGISMPSVWSLMSKVELRKIVDTAHNNIPIVQHGRSFYFGTIQKGA